MTSPWQPPGQPYGMDMFARRMAEQAAAQASQAAQRTCRLATARTTVLLAVGGTVDLAVVWSAPMTAASYVVEAVAGPGILGNASVAVKSQTAAGCVVTVTASLAVAVGGIVFCHARSS